MDTVAILFIYYLTRLNFKQLNWTTRLVVPSIKVSVDLKIRAMKEYSTFPRSPELDPHQSDIV